MKVIIKIHIISNLIKNAVMKKKKKIQNTSEQCGIQEVVSDLEEPPGFEEEVSY